MTTDRSAIRTSVRRPAIRLLAPGRRLTTAIVSVALVASLLVVAPLVLDETPAGAEGFNFLCEAPGGGGGGGSSEFEQLAEGLALEILQNEAIWVFHGTVPAGVPVTVPGSVTDPVTGETSFQVPIAPTLGVNQQLDFIDGSVVPGAAGPEISFGFSFRGLAGQGPDNLSMRDLFVENFGVTPDAGTDVSVAGVDINFQTNQVMGEMQGFRGRFSAFYTYALADGSTELAVGTFTIDSQGPGFRLPENASLSLAIRRPPDSTSSFVAFGQRAVHTEFDGVTNQPGVGFGIDLTRAELTPTTILFDPFVSMKLDWTAAPQSVAVGVGSFCPDKGHLAWNHNGLPNPASAAVDVDVAYGIEEGQPTRVDTPTGPADVRANIFDVEGRINSLPAQLDVILTRDALSFTRSPDVAPDLILNRLAMADDDPAVANDRPTFATAEVTDLPRHLLVATQDAADGSFARGDITSWTLSCPTEPPPTGPAAPADVRRLDLPETLPAFPPGCARHALTPVPSAGAVVQDWLPEDLTAQAGTAGLAAPPPGTGQFGYVAVREPAASFGTSQQRSFQAFGGRLNAVQRVTVDVTSAAAAEEQIRAYIERAPLVAADDSFRIVGEIDTRTSANELVNTGRRIVAGATIVDLPDRIRLDYRTDPSTPFELSWRTSTRISIAAGSFHSQGPAPDASIINGAFETNVGTFAAPPTATLRLTDKPADGGGTFSWVAAPAPTDGFPTPPEPTFNPATRTRLHAGAQITTRAERDAGTATRLHADVTVGQPVVVDWTELNGQLDALDATLCGLRGIPASCASNRFDATVVKNSEPTLTGDALLVPPALPTPTASVAAAIQPFTDFRPNINGVRAVNISRNRWGADLLVRGLAHLSYGGTPIDLAAELAAVTPQPMVLNFLDSTKTTGRIITRTEVMFADAVVDRMPSDVRVRLQGPDAGSDEPLVWVNTEDVTIDDLDTIDWTPDAVAGRPTLTGVVRYGDAGLLSAEIPAASRPRPRAPGVNGVDVWADYALDSKLVAVDVATRLTVPRHTAIYRPDLTRCDETSPDVSTCQERPVYEMDEVQTVRAELIASIAELGQLNVLADIHGSGLNWTLRSFVARLPGTLVGNLRIADNVRLPWLQVDAELHGSQPFDQIRIEVFDRDKPVEYRRSADPEDEGQCTNPGDRCTSNYAVVLSNVGTDLEVTGRVRGSSEGRITAEPDEPPPPNEPQTDVGGLAFVHAQVDLHNLAERLVVDGWEGGDGQFVGSLRAFGPGHNSAHVSGFFNARVDHIEVDLDSAEGSPDPFDIFVFDSGGVIGVLASLFTDHGAAIGRPFQLITFGIDLVFGVILDFLLSGTARTRIDLDLDLPLWVAFDQVDTVRFGMNGTTLSVDERHPFAGGSAEIGTLQFAMSHEPALQINGAFVHHRNVDFTFDATVDGFDIDNTATNQLVDIRLMGHQQCLTHDDSNQCYRRGGLNAVRLHQLPAPPREAGFASTDLVLDLFFTEPNRDEMEGEDAGNAEPGVEFYTAIAEASRPVAGKDFFLPEMAIGSSEPDVFLSSTYCCNTTTFQERALPNQPPPPPPIVRNYGPVCDASSDLSANNGPRARGRDGTVYAVVIARTRDANTSTDHTFCRGTRRLLVAHWGVPGEELGPVRWSIELPTPRGLEPNGQCRRENVRCDFVTSVNPRPDGSVQVDIFTLVALNGVDGNRLDILHQSPFRPTVAQQDKIALFLCCHEPVVRNVDGAPIGSVRAWVDASGHPGFHRSGDAQVPAFTVVTQGSGATDGVVTLQPCQIAPTFGCGPLPAGHRVQWLFGDGTKSSRLTAAAPTAHAYPHTPGTDQFLGVLVQTDAQGRLVNKAYFRLGI